MKKKYPWGVDAEEKPQTNEDCGKIVHSMAKLKICMKGLAKRESQLKSVATTMYATMKKKSQDSAGSVAIATRRIFRALIHVRLVPNSRSPAAIVRRL